MRNLSSISCCIVSLIAFSFNLSSNACEADLQKIKPRQGAFYVYSSPYDMFMASQIKKITKKGEFWNIEIIRRFTNENTKAKLELAPPNQEVATLAGILPLYTRNPLGTHGRSFEYAKSEIAKLYNLQKDKTVIINAKDIGFDGKEMKIRNTQISIKFFGCEGNDRIFRVIVPNYVDNTSDKQKEASDSIFIFDIRKGWLVKTMPSIYFNHENAKSLDLIRTILPDN